MNPGNHPTIFGLVFALELYTNLNALIKSLLKKLVQLLFVGVISYAGNFIVVEEISEKTEKTERSEEAIHSQYHSKKFSRAVELAEVAQTQSLGTHYSFTNTFKNAEGQHNFNIDHMYYTSHLKPTI
ncbi:hypothetical protein [Ekhidna sp.]|uniref:hypothetical protein n=1 Tax=Ekhidna sp. TaxID=2608089 RepID=UPI0032968945